MQSFIIIYAFFIGTYCVPIFDEQLNSQWLSFKKIHKKQYNSIDEETARRIVWENNLVKISQHNYQAQLGIHSYTLGMNQFGDMTHEEFKKRMNLFKISNKIENNQINDDVLVVPTNRTVPRAVDWRKRGSVTSVKDQGECAASWAFSAIGALEGQHVTQTKKLVSLSVQNLIDCSTNFGNSGCNRGAADFAFQYVTANGGVDTEQSYPYEGRNGTCRFNRTNVGANSTGYRDVKSQDEAALTYAISIIGPIAITIDASHASFQFYRSGVYNESGLLINNSKSFSFGRWFQCNRY